MKQAYIKQRFSIVAVMFITLCWITLIPQTSCSEEKTKLKSPMPTPRMNTACAVIGDKVYVIGGLTKEGEITPVVEEYDSSIDRWTRKTSMPTSRGVAAAAVVNNKIYVFGGRDENGVTDVVEVYDPLSNSWKKMKPMPFARWNHMVAVAEGKIYVIGGLIGVGNKRESVDKVEIYDPSIDSWNIGASIPKPKQNAAVAVMGKKIYVIGGMIGSAALGGYSTNTVEVYDLSAGKWITGVPMQLTRSDADAVVVNDKIYVVGGGKKGEALGTVEVYNSATNLWESGFSLRKPRTGHCVASVGNKIFIIGGAAEQSLSGILDVVEEFSLKTEKGK